MFNEAGPSLRIPQASPRAFIEEHRAEVMTAVARVLDSVGTFWAMKFAPLSKSSRVNSTLRVRWASPTALMRSR